MLDGALYVLNTLKVDLWPGESTTATAVNSHFRYKLSRMVEIASLYSNLVTILASPYLHD
jgi:hypothetical protein